jgi:hypothetical protein
MPISEARVQTERSGRYLVQVCRHVGKIVQRQPEMEAHVEWSDDGGVIDFGWGRCTFRAEPEVLTLRAQASDEEGLRRLEQRVTDRLQRFARDEDLTITWTPLPETGGTVAAPRAIHDEGGRTHG